MFRSDETDDAINQGEIGRDDGLLRAALRKQWVIQRDTLRLLDAIITAPDLTATTDDAVENLLDVFDDGGQWRGNIPKELAKDGLIIRVDIVRSTRKARHRGWTARWRAHDRQLIDCRRAYLRKWLENNSPPPDEDEGQGKLFSISNNTQKPSPTDATAGLAMKGNIECNPDAPSPKS